VPADPQTHNNHTARTKEYPMNEMIEAIRAAVAEGATVEQKAAGAQACRTILTALEVEPGKAIVLASAPAPSPLAGMSGEQAMDLLIARLSALVPSEKAERKPALKIALVSPPRRGGGR
jgi:hypothetical protein